MNDNFWKPKDPPDINVGMPEPGNAQSYQPIHCGPCLDKGKRIIVGYILASKPGRGLCIKCRAARLLGR